MGDLRSVSLTASTYLSILLIAFGASAQDSTASKPREWGKEAGPFRLSISSDRDKYTIGEAIKITAILKNVSDHSVIFRRTGPAAFQFQMDIRLPMPAWIPWKPRAPLTPLGQQEMDPRLFSGIAGAEARVGAEMTDEVEISKLFEMSTPGDYSITFSCRQQVGSPKDQSGAERPMVTVVSNQITVTVLPRQP